MKKRYVNLIASIASFFGANKEQFRVLFETKLTIDARTSIQKLGKRKNKFSTFFARRLSLIFMGFCLLPQLLKFSEDSIRFVSFFSYIFVMLFVITLVELAPVLFERKDLEILSPRPVDSKTISLLRIFHMQHFLLFACLCLALSPWIYTCIHYPLATSLLFILALICVVNLVILVFVSMFSFFGKYLKPDTFKRALGTIQIVLFVLFMVLIQVVNYIKTESITEVASLYNNWFSLAYPITWFVGLVSIPFQGMSLWTLVASVLALLLPILGTAFLSHFFGETTGKLGALGKSNAATKRKPALFKKDFLAQLFCISSYELAGWKLSKAFWKNDTRLKQGHIIMYVYGLLVLGFGVYRGLFTETGLFSDHGYEEFIYFSLVSIVLSAPVLNAILFSDTKDAKWMFYVTPVHQLGHIRTGAVKALFVSLLLPMYVLIIAMVLFYYSPQEYATCMFALLGSYSYVLLLVRAQGKELPFCTTIESQQVGEKIMIVLLSFICIGLFVGICYLLFQINWAFSLIGIALLLGLNRYQIKHLREKSVVLSSI